MFDINEIKNINKHRYPFLLLDRVLEYEEGKRAKGLKNVTINEAFFNGHFPEQPILPGVLIIESMAQLASILTKDMGNVLGFLSSIYNARFLKPVVPGDQLIIEVEIYQRVKNLYRIKAKAEVSEKKVAAANLGFIILNVNEIKGKMNE
ncbi:MAG: 3-hydroxyacyl-[acyl-carrier-protein] dehydratase FabZ [Spirochaetes bacterium RBG_16_49_21]|nr:MAG: 3-hydroxyacyl-[acyl-carrier-protein] dehydratase FabZ [Spirochaetes bacterium RBG_16_49_21]